MAEVTNIVENKFGKIKYENGQKMHNVIFLREIHSEVDRKAIFLCSCGKEFSAFIHSVKSNVTKSCGCYRSSYMKKKQTKHGLSRHPLYDTYNNMMERCYTVTNNSYHDYGGRGVIVCEEWKNDFVSFYNWAISNGWNEGLQIDKDILGTGLLYSPNNCCFVTGVKNCNKRRSSRYIEYGGETKMLSEWASALGIGHSTIWARINSGWDLNRVFNTPTHK